MEGDTLRVIATVVHDAPGGTWPDSTVALIQIVDRRSRVQFADSMPPVRDAYGALMEEIIVDAQPVRFDGGRGLMLGRMDLPSDPSYLGDCRYFAVRGRALVPVTPWCGACGPLEPRNIAHDSRWMAWFRVFVPIRIHVERLEGGLEVVAERDTASGLAVLKIGEVERFYEEPDTSFHLRLFRTAAGTKSDSVLVSKSSRVTFGRLYARLVVGSAAREGQFDIEIRRLEVTVEGRHGFVEEAEFRALGLREAG